MAQPPRAASLSGPTKLTSAVSILNAIGIGVMLPQIFFVNDLGHPLQTGLLLALFPMGRLVGKRIFAIGRSLVLQNIVLVLAYLLMIVFVVVHPTGFRALFLAQTAWFLISLFGANLLFVRGYGER